MYLVNDFGMQLYRHIKAHVTSRATKLIEIGTKRQFEAASGNFRGVKDVIFLSINVVACTAFIHLVIHAYVKILWRSA